MRSPNGNHAFLVFFKVGTGVLSSSSPVKTYYVYQELVKTANETDAADVTDFNGIKDCTKEAKEDDTFKTPNVTYTTDEKNQPLVRTIHWRPEVKIRQMSWTETEKKKHMWN